MNDFIYSFSSPDLGFIPAPVRLDHNSMMRFFIFGQGSLGKSMRTALTQAGFAITRGYDNDVWERRNLHNTLGLTADRVGRNKGFRANILSAMITHTEHFRVMRPGQRVQPVFILSTDNIVTRSTVMHHARTKGALVIDMRSSPELTRTICIDGRQVDQWLDRDEEATTLFNYLYPPVQYNAENQEYELEDPSMEGTGNEGGCMMRGSMMHTLTCISRAMQFVFRRFQPGYNRAFEIIEDHPWTGVSTQQSFGPELNRGLLQDHAPSYEELEAREHRSHTLVTQTERPPWTGEVPSRSNEINGMAQAEGRLFYEWTDTSTADTSGSAETATSN